MEQVKFIIRINFSTLDSCSSFKDYSLYAGDKEDAKSIALLIFKNEENTKLYKIDNVGVKYDKPSKDEIDEVNRQLINTYGVVKSTFTRMSYESFLKAYTNFEGTDFKCESNGGLSYYVTFQGFKFKVCYKNNIVYVDEKELIYFSRVYNRKYVILDDCVTILIGR